MIFPVRMLRLASAGAILPGTPAPNAMGFGVAYQAADPTKPAFVSIIVDVNHVVTLAGVISDELELRIGPDANVALATNPTGFSVARFKKSIKGITVAIGLEVGQSGQMATALPVGWYYAVRRISGTAATITSAMVQPLSKS